MESSRYSSEKLAAYVAQIRFEDLPDGVVDKARQCLRDAIGCLLGAYQFPVAQNIEDFLVYSGGGNARLPGSVATADIGTVAYANATLINVLDFDDIYKKGHPGATVIGAVLAMGDFLKSSPEELIAAIVAGYEVGCRVGISLLQTQPRKLLHGHGTWQTLGAAAASAWLLRLDGEQTAHALAIAAVNAPVASVMKTVYGVKPSMAKNNFGVAAQVGVNAAMYARFGGEGPLDVFDGETGFWRMFGADGCDVSAYDVELGVYTEIREVGFKPYSCCRILQSSIEAALSAAKKGGVTDPASQVAEIVVCGPEILMRPPFCDKHPEDMWAAQFSAPHTIAMALLNVATGPDWFSPENLTSDARNTIVSTVVVEPSTFEESGKSKAKSHHHESTVTMILRDGNRVDAKVSVAIGEAGNPIGETDLRAKFMHLAMGRLGAERAEQAAKLFDRFASLPSAPGILEAISV